jgi:DNA-binding response OmpR family regulator
MKVLLVDDNPDITDLLSKFLKAKGHENVVANDPLEGLEKIKNNQFDIVFLDIQMPGLSGLEIIQELEIQNILRPKHHYIFCK